LIENEELLLFGLTGMGEDDPEAGSALGREFENPGRKGAAPAAGAPQTVVWAVVAVFAHRGKRRDTQRGGRLLQQFRDAPETRGAAGADLDVAAVQGGIEVVIGMGGVAGCGDLHAIAALEADLEVMIFWRSEIIRNAGLRFVNNLAWSASTASQLE